MNKVAIITASSKGMGRASAVALAEAGFKVVLLARSPEITSIAEGLGGIGIQGSVTETADLEKTVDAALDQFGRVDVLVNSTGHPPKGQLLELSDEDWYAGTDMVFMNVVRMARLVAPIMEKQGGGTIINISTFAAFEPSLNFPVSSVMRAALGSFAKLFAQEYGKHNIRMNNVLPGYIESYPADEVTIAQIPLRRQGSLKEIGETVRFLASEGGAYISGENLKVDGGITKHV